MQTVSALNNMNESEYSGQVVGRYETNLAFQVGGRIIDRYIEAGSIVQAGDVLMRIDSRDLQQSLNNSAAQLDSAASQLKLAEVNWNRYRLLFEQDAVSESTYDQYRNSYEAALAQFRQAQAQYEQSGNSLGYTELTALNDGVVSQVNVESGQVVSAGQTAVVLVSDNEREVEINVPENRLDLLRSDINITVTFWALPEQPPVRAVVREISPVADSITRTYKVRLTLVDVSANIKLGMTAKVNINAATAQRAITIPLTAVYQTGDLPQVWIIREGKAHLQAVVISGWGDNAVQVTDGLADGDVLITAGVHKISEGQQVEPLDGAIK